MLEWSYVSQSSAERDLEEEIHAVTGNTAAYHLLLLFTGEYST